MRIALVLPLLFIPLSLPVHAQAKKKDPATLAREREERAQRVLDAAERYEKSGKLYEAREKYRELKSEHGRTAVYLRRMSEISEKIHELGSKIAVTRLGKVKLYRQPHVDSWFGYTFSPPDGWKGIPPRQAFVGDMDNAEDWRAGYLQRLCRYTADFHSKIYLQVYKLWACPDLDALIDKCEGYLADYFPGAREISSTTLRTRRAIVPRRVYESKDGDRIVGYYYFGERKGLALLCFWRAGSQDNEFVVTTRTTTGGRVLFTTGLAKKTPVTEREFDAALKSFDKVAQTFWIYDQSTRSAMAKRYDRGARCSDWNVMVSPKGHYLIEYASSKEYAKKVAERMDLVFALYSHVLPSTRRIPRCRLKLFDRKEDFNYYSMAGSGAAAYWSPGQEEIVCYRFAGKRLTLDSKEEVELRETEDSEDVTLKVLHHEGFHQYMYFYLGKNSGIYIPSWLNEGLGDYFFGGKFSTKRRKFDVEVNDWRIKKIHKAVKEGTYVPIDRILKYKQADYYRNASLCYAQGWSMNYFFLSEEGQKLGYGTIPRRMINELKTTRDDAKARLRVFSGVDLKALETHWKKFVLALPVPEEEAPPDPVVIVGRNVVARKMPAKPLLKRELAGEADLLSLVDVKKDGVQGAFTKDGDALVTPAEKFARLQFPYVAPEEYDVTLTAARTGANDSLVLGLTAGGRSFAVNLNGWNGTTSGIDSLDGRRANANESSADGAVFPDAEPHRITVNVRKTGVIVWVDGISFIAWKGALKRLGPPSGWNVPNPDALWVGSSNTTYKITAFKVKPVTGKGGALR